MKRSLTFLAAAALSVASLTASADITTPRDSQASSVTQSIGLVSVTINYSSPRVHSPRGEDRKGAIWGKLVPYGMSDLSSFGTCKECPWRAGANENTVFTTSHDVMIEGQKLAAGSYGLHMIPGQDEWTIVFSKNSTGWGSYFYDASEDVLRVKVKPAKSEYHEALTYDFLDRQADKATVALQWEELQVPFTITVPNSDALYMDKIAHELRGDPGFYWQNYVDASQYALGHGHKEKAVEWAQVAVSRPNVGQENFRTLSALAEAQEAAGQVADAKATREKALNHRSASAVDLHGYARQLLNKKNKDEAIRVWQLNAKLHPNEWPVNVGLARSYSASGNYKEGLKYAKLAQTQAPDDANKKSLEGAIKKLEAGQDIN
jgi:tetratricopeptide (TPR) repeat protein